MSFRSPLVKICVGNEHDCHASSLRGLTYETNVALDMGKETLVLGVLGDEALESTANHGVLTHQDDTLAAEGLTDLVHLLGRDTVDASVCEWPEDP